MRKAPFGAFFYFVFGFVMSVMCSLICVISSSSSCLMSGLNSRDAFIRSAVILSSRYRAILALSNCGIGASWLDRSPPLVERFLLLLSVLLYKGRRSPPSWEGGGRGVGGSCGPPCARASAMPIAYR